MRSRDRFLLRQERDPAMRAFKRRLGRNIRILRKMSGMTGESFADSLHISRDHLSKLERAQAYSMVLDSLYHLIKIVDLKILFTEELSEKVRQATAPRQVNSDS